MQAKVEGYINEGKLKREEAELELIERLMREAVFELDEAQKTHEIAAYRATFFLSYMAMLRAGRALLLLNGYRPANCSQHQTIAELTAELLGDTHEDLTQHFLNAQNKEHNLLHNKSSLLTENESHDAFHNALLLNREVVKMIKKKNPNFQVAM